MASAKPWKRTAKPSGWYPRRGEICYFLLDKERPALVISTDALNRFSQDICVIPLSTVEPRQFVLRPKLDARLGGLPRDSWARCDQPTTLRKAFAVYPPLEMLSPDRLLRIETATPLRVAAFLTLSNLPNDYADPAILKIGHNSCGKSSSEAYGAHPCNSGPPRNSNGL